MAALSESVPYPYAESKVLREYGMLHIREGEPEQARKRLSAALGIFRRLGASDHAGQTERALGTVARQRPTTTQDT